MSASHTHGALTSTAGIASASLRREKTSNRFTQQAVLDENHALNQLVTEAQSGKRQRLNSCHSFPDRSLLRL